MNNGAVTQVGSPSDAGAMAPYYRSETAAWEPAAHAIDVYVPPSDSDDVDYRYADPQEIATARSAIVEALDYYADHQVWGWPVFYTKSSTAETFRDLIRNMATGDVLFPPEAILDVLAIEESRQVRSRKRHMQNLLVDRNKDQTTHQRESRMELEVLRIWAKCVDEVTHEMTDNPNARALCSYTDYLIEGAQAVLFQSNGGWVQKMTKRFESLRTSLNTTIDNNEQAYQEICGGEPDFGGEG